MERLFLSAEQQACTAKPSNGVMSWALNKPPLSGCTASIVASTVANTVLVVPFRGFVPGKHQIMSMLLLTSPYPAVVGVDDRCSERILKNTLTFVNTLSAAKANARAPNSVILSVQLAYFSMGRLRQKYSTKSDYFNGKHSKNPAKLGALDWFVTSGYDFMWHMEDDVFTPDVAAFVAPYSAGPMAISAPRFDNSSLPFLPPTFNVTKWRSEQAVWARSQYSHIRRGGGGALDCAATASLVGMALRQLPFWFSSGWRVGDQLHGLRAKTPNHLNPSAMRLSKPYAHSLLNAIARGPGNSTHHEVPMT